MRPGEEVKSLISAPNAADTMNKSGNVRQAIVLVPVPNKIDFLEGKVG